MIENIGILSGFISSLFILIYTLMYLTRDVYSSTNNDTIKKYTNKLLPIFSRYNRLYIILVTIFALIHFLSFVKISAIINSGYVVLFIVFFIIKITFYPSKNSNYNYDLNIFSYLLFVSLMVHLIIK